MSNAPVAERVSTLVLEYAQNGATGRPLDPRLSLRGDLGIDSLSLVSLTVRLGEDLGVDIAEKGTELGRLRTVGDLLALARALQKP